MLPNVLLNRLLSFLPRMDQGWLGMCGGMFILLALFGAVLPAQESAAARGAGAEALRVLSDDGVALDQEGVILHSRYVVAVVSATGDAMEQRRAVSAGLRQMHDALLRQRYATEAKALGDLWSRASALLPLRLQSDGAVIPLENGLQAVVLDRDTVDPLVEQLPATLSTVLEQQNWSRTPVAAEAMLHLAPLWDLSIQRRALSAIDPEAPPPASHLPRLAVLASLRTAQERAALEAYARACVAARMGAEAEQAVAVLSHYEQLTGSWPLLAHSMGMQPMHQHQQLTHGDTMSLMGLQPQQVLDDAAQWLTQAHYEWQQEQPQRALLALRQALTQWPSFDADQQLRALQLYADLADALSLSRTHTTLLQKLEALQSDHSPSAQDAQP
ncbi:MAG: hypothetical protein EA401_03580 [Planctomycetota bacterium]|nr:MAG: hypothetical protein EA401_03580 [Planctomycetota bacterium]